ncbi:MAG: DNA translocase FtsK 4TM domain-containing protein [Aaplasma endosymbiont of Hyalomma asiaticum]
MKYITGWFRFCIIAVLVVLVVVSVFTHDIDDPSLNSTSTFQDIAATKNAIGNFGAYLADFLIQLMGAASIMPAIFLILSFRNILGVVYRIYVPCVFLVTFGFAGILSKLSLNVTNGLFHGGLIGEKFAAVSSLPVLIVVVIVGVFGSVGWRASVFLSRAFVKVLSEISLWMSAGRIRRSRMNFVMETGRLSGLKHANCAPEMGQGEPSDVWDGNVFYGVRKTEVMRGGKCADKPNARECVQSGHISVLFPPKSYGYEERQCEKTVSNIVTESEGITKEKNLSLTRNGVDMRADNRFVVQYPKVRNTSVSKDFRVNSDVEHCVSSLDSKTRSESLNNKSEEELCDEDDGDGDYPALSCVESSRPFAGEFATRGHSSVSDYLKVDGSIINACNQTLNFVLPHVDLLKSRAIVATKSMGDGCMYKDESEELYSVLKDFGVHGKIIDVRYGPVVTLYEFEPSAGTKSSRIIGLADDIARSMSALSTRISVVPGRNVLGIELPNRNREMVVLRDLLCSKEYNDPGLRLPIILGKGIDGDPVVGDLTKMPHLLIAGTTGSGKSVGINTMILSLLYRLTPQQCRMIMIDPKVLELSVYDNIPHLLTPVVTEPKKAVAVLKWVVAEMEERYRLMSAVGVRNITGYNEKVAELAKGKVKTGQNSAKCDLHDLRQRLEYLLPYIVVVVDEMADLMIVSGKEIESSIQRLSQMARAAGIHIIMATQRPSVDVITGVIKANFPTRISFSVTSKVDSRTILGEQGAEQLLGMGDMLYMVAGGKIRRIHGAFVSDSEVQDVVNHLRGQSGPGYIEGIAKVLDSGEEMYLDDLDERDDALYEKAVSIVLRDRKTSVSYVQRQLRIGYNRAANLVERMEREGIITAAGSLGKREIVGN